MPTSSPGQIIYRASRHISNLQEVARQLTLREAALHDILLHAGNSKGNARLSKAKCLKCSGTGYASEQDLLDGAIWVSSQRPGSNVDFDQVPVTDVDLARRVHAVLEYHDPLETSFAFIGDADLASLLLLHVCSPRRVLVIDIDSRILDVIRENSAPVSYNADLRIQKLIGENSTPTSYTDLRLVNANLADWSYSLGLLGKESDTYDAVVTDPPYSDRGMLVYIYMAAMLLKPGGRLYLAVPHLTAESWSDEMMQLIQRELLSLGFVIDMLTPGFFTYSESEMMSSLLFATKLQRVDLNSLTTKVEALSLQPFYPGQRYPKQSNSKSALKGGEDAI